MRRIGLRSDQHEVVEHHFAPVDAVAVRNKLVLADPVMDEQRVGIAARADRQRLAGADGNDANGNARSPC